MLKHQISGEDKAIGGISDAISNSMPARCWEIFRCDAQDLLLLRGRKMKSWVAVSIPSIVD